MTENKHTPGPWKYYGKGHPVGPAIVPASGPEIKAWWNDCPDMRSEAEHEANGVLSAAAPELLAVLEPFAYLARVMDEGNVLNFRGVYISYEQAKAAEAAIAKARGEEAAHD